MAKRKLQIYTEKEQDIIINLLWDLTVRVKIITPDQYGEISRYLAETTNIPFLVSSCG